MTSLPELPEARRRKTAAMICAYLEVEQTPARIELLKDVLKAGELEMLVREISIQRILQTPKWEEFAEECKIEMRKVHRIAESFFVINTGESDASR